MKKRFAGIAALGMALTLAFGMTVSAAPSASAEDSNYEDVVLQDVADKSNATGGTIQVDGKDVTVELEVKPVSKQEQGVAVKAVQEQAEVIREKVLKMIPEVEEVAAATELKTLPAIDVKPTNGLTNDQIKAAGGVEVRIQHAQLENGKYYVLVHIMENGAVETLDPVKASNGTVTVKVMGFSTFVPVEVPVTVSDDGDDDDNDDSSPATTESGAPASPKTGEVLPLAGFMAVICLAGAVVCVKKAHN